MQKLKFINSLGEEINFTDGVNFGVTEWNGLSEVPVNIQSQQVPFRDGSVYLDNVLGERNLSFTVALNDGKDLYNRYKKIREVIAILNPKLEEGYLYYENDFLIKRIKCVPEAPIFPTKNYDNAGTLKFSISFIANNPYWEDIDTISMVVTQGENDILVTGDADVDCEIYVEGGEVTNLVIENETTGKKIIFPEVEGNFKMNLNTGNKLVRKAEKEYHIAGDLNLNFVRKPFVKMYEDKIFFYNEGEKLGYIDKLGDSIKFINLGFGIVFHGQNRVIKFKGDFYFRTFEWRYRDDIWKIVDDEYKIIDDELVEFSQYIDDKKILLIGVCFDFMVGAVIEPSESGDYVDIVFSRDMKNWEYMGLRDEYPIVRNYGIEIDLLNSGTTNILSIGLSGSNQDKNVYMIKNNAEWLLTDVNIKSNKVFLENDVIFEIKEIDYWKLNKIKLNQDGTSELLETLTFPSSTHVDGRSNGKWYIGVGVGSAVEAGYYSTPAIDDVSQYELISTNPRDIFLGSLNENDVLWKCNTSNPPGYYIGNYVYTDLILTDNLISTLSPNSDMDFKLIKGNNKIKISTSSGNVGGIITFRNKYIGV